MQPPVQQHKKSILPFLSGGFYLSHTPLWMRLLYPGGVEWQADSSGNKVYLTFDDGPVPGPTEFVLDELQRFGFTATFFCIGDNVRKHPQIFRRILAEGHAVGNHTMHHLNGWKTPADDYLHNIATADALIGSHLFRPPYGRITREQVKRIKVDSWQKEVDSWQLAVDSGRLADERWRMTEDGKLADDSWQVADGSGKMTDERWQMTEDGKLADNSWQMADGNLKGDEQKGIREDKSDLNEQKPGMKNEEPEITNQKSQLKNPKIILWSVLTGDFDTSINGDLCFERVKRHTKAGSIIVFHDSEKAFPRLQTGLPKALAWIKEQGLQPATLT